MEIMLGVIITIGIYYLIGVCVMLIDMRLDPEIWDFAISMALEQIKLPKFIFIFVSFAPALIPLFYLPRWYKIIRKGV